jgi:hypothetical protein
MGLFSNTEDLPKKNIKKKKKPRPAKPANK